MDKKTENGVKCDKGIHVVLIRFDTMPTVLNLNRTIVNVFE